MKYMGSKRRIAKYIAPIIQAHIDSGNYKTYIEPFVGGANMIEHIKCENRCGSDINEYLIAALIAISEDPSQFPDLVTESVYEHIQQNKDMHPKHIVGYVGFAMSFGGKFFGGYRRDKAGSKGCPVNMATQSRRSLQDATRQHSLLEDVQFTRHSYKNWAPENCVVYCDPPYQKTTKYSTDGFSHKEFWLWCRKYSRPEYNNVILVSEYEAPEMFAKCIWQKEINSSLTKDTGSKKGTEKLFWVRD